GLEKRKGVDVLIEAFHQLAPHAPDWHLYVAGDGPERAALEALAAREESGRRIHFLGYVESPRPVLEQADIFALASHAEPFGLSLAEARHAGCAVIGTNVGGIPEVLDNGAAGALVPPGDPAALAAKLRELTTDPSALAEARQRAKRNSDRFNVRRVAEDYMHLYELAVRQRPSPMTSVPTRVSLAPPASSQHLRIAVGIATLGRPRVLAQTLQRLTTQTRQADRIVVCTPDSSDLQGAQEAYPGVTEVIGPRGLARQRNAIIEATRDCDVIVFFDDDFVAQEDYLANVEAAMLAHPDVVMTTGRLLDDGILGPGLSFADADRMLSERRTEPPLSAPVADVYNGYGCNMSMRLAPITAHKLAFDERLPLYGWLEDVDFSRQLARHGRIVSIDARGVHLGVKQGRQPGLKLGYSQVANPLYLIGKGTMSPGRALRLMGRNLLANAVRSLRAEPWVDRRGRLSGNLRAVADLLTGRLDPNRVAGL
ncbi:MAG: glycosyltransferase, partial [Hyphomicrobium sp.]